MKGVQDAVLELVAKAAPGSVREKDVAMDLVFHRGRVQDAVRKLVAAGKIVKHRANVEGRAFVFLTLAGIAIPEAPPRQLPVALEVQATAVSLEDGRKFRTQAKRQRNDRMRGRGVKSRVNPPSQKETRALLVAEGRPMSSLEIGRRLGHSQHVVAQGLRRLQKRGLVKEVHILSDARRLLFTAVRRPA